MPGSSSGLTTEGVDYRLDAEAQREILGPAAHDAYAAGLIDLPDLVQTMHDPVWGTTRTVKPLSRALKDERRAA